MAKYNLEKFTFFKRLFFMQSVFAFIISSIIIIVVYQNIHAVLVEETRDSAIEQAEIFASNLELKKALKKQDAVRIEELVRSIRMPIGTDYVVVADSVGKRIFNTAGVGIGVVMPSYQIVNVLKGHAASFVDYNDSVITNIKSRVPVMEDNQVIGIVAVGMSYNIAVNRMTKYLVIAAGISISLFLILVGCSHLFVSYLNRTMLQKSPYQIEVVFKLYESILNSIFEGIIAVDPKNKILATNKAAEDYLNLSDVHESLIGRHISKYLYPADFFQNHGDTEVVDQTISCNGERLIANRTPFYDMKNKYLGTVITLRRKTEKEELEQAVIAAIEDKKNMRALSHEFSNQLAVIYGLLEVNKFEDVKAYIHSEHVIKKNEVVQISKSFNVSILIGLLLSKMSRARELGISLEINVLSNVQAERLLINDKELTCIIGNLIDNAFEAIIRSNKQVRMVSLFANNLGDELIVEVADSGVGGCEDKIDLIFERGYSSKDDEEHGIGLSLVKEIVDNNNGHIIVEESELGGAMFTLFIPQSSTQVAVNE
jgi:two-component system cit operon sensor histidine kinase CitA